MTPHFCEPNCPKLYNCGFMSKDDDIRKMVDEIFKDRKCPCSECIIIVKCGCKTDSDSICNDRSRIFEKVESMLYTISKKEIENIRNNNDIFHK